MAEKIEKLEVNLDLTDVIGLTFKFPVRVSPLEGARSRGAYFAKVGLLSKVEGEFTGLDGWKATLLTIMDEMIAFYKNKDTEEALWFNTNFVNKYYDPMTPMQNLDRFLGLFWLDIDFVNKITEHVSALTVEYEDASKRIKDGYKSEFDHVRKNFAAAKKEIEKLPQNEETQQKREEAVKVNEQKIKELEEKIENELTQLKLDLLAKYEDAL